MRYATAEKVAVAWLTTIPGITTAMVDPQLPAPDSNGAVSWAATGFITPYGVGGKPDIYVPVARPVVGIKCWWYDPDTGRPPWNKATQLAETIRAGVFATSQQVFLTVRDSDQAVILQSVYMLAEPRRAFGDVGDFACVDFELQMNWAAH